MRATMLAGALALAVASNAGGFAVTGTIRGAGYGLKTLDFQFFEATTGALAHAASATALVSNGTYMASIPAGALVVGKTYIPVVRAADSLASIALAFPPPVVTMVQLQGGTPGTKQTGNFNVSGVGIAGRFTADGAGFFGTGSGLTSLNASNISSGTLADARLSTNVMLLNNAQTVTGVKTFAAAPAFTNAGAPFTVANSTVVTNLNADLLDGLTSAAFVQLAGAQTITGAKTFTGGLLTDAFRLTIGGAAGRVLRSDAVGNGAWGTDGLALPFSGSGDVTGDRNGVLEITDTAAVSGNAIMGVLGAASTVDLTPWQQGAVFGDSNAQSGVLGVSSLSNGVGCFGLTSGPSSAGVYGNTAQGDGIGVLGRAVDGDGGTFSSTTGDGVDATSSSGFAGRFTGNTLTSGDVSKRFTATTSDPINMIAHGNVNSTGTVAGGTPNWTVSYNTTTDEYTISVTGKTIDLFFDTVVVTPTTSVPVIPTTTTSGGDLIVRLWNLSGVKVQGRFQFVIWQPNRTDRPTYGDPAGKTNSPRMERNPELANRYVDLDAIGKKSVRP